MVLGYPVPLRSLSDAFDTQTVSLGPRSNVRVSTVHAYNMSNVLYVCYSTSTCMPLCSTMISLSAWEWYVPCR